MRIRRSWSNKGQKWKHERERAFSNEGKMKSWRINEKEKYIQRSRTLKVEKVKESQDRKRQTDREIIKDNKKGVRANHFMGQALTNNNCDNFSFPP